MRSVAYIAIVALAATQGMGIPRDVKFIFEPTVLVKGCSVNDATIRCASVHQGNQVDEWKLTQECMNELGNARDCYCWSTASYFAVANNNLAEFKLCCAEKSATWKEC